MSTGEAASCDKPGVDFDALLVQDIGQFGCFQWRILATSVLVGVFTAWSSAEYIFTTAPLNTRCLINECEVAGSTEFCPPWLPNAVPSAGGGSFDSCRRYAPNITVEDTDDMCPASLFDPTTIIACEEYVFEDTYTVVYDLELACDEWRRSLIGSMRNLGMLIAMPVTGFVSDHWGRRTALVINAVNTAWLGTVRYWANSYVGFVIGQLVEATLGSGAFSCAYILLLELVGPEYRVLAGATTTTGVALGLMTVALIAWLIPYWRYLTLALFLPQLLGILYIWIMPESIRWYQSKGKFDKAEALIKKVAKVNGKTVSEKTLLDLQENADAQNNKGDDDKKQNEPWLVVQVFQHKSVLIRCLISPVWWITTTFIYYGLSVNAVNMAGNKYLNFALVSVVEIPGIWTSVLLVDRVGRRPVIAGGFFLCALCQLGYIFISNDMAVASLLAYLVGKSSIATVMTAVYVYTAELFPTQYRHSLFAYSAMMGYVGAILAPLTPAMSAAVFDALPFVLFGSMALLAGLLVLVTPETRGTRLPDTMHQANCIGRENHPDVEEPRPSSS